VNMISQWNVCIREILVGWEYLLIIINTCCSLTNEDSSGEAKVSSKTLTFTGSSSDSKEVKKSKVK
jgi:hypothetical protein